jgi:hypothetical protein
MAKLIKCNLCKDDEQNLPFYAAADEIGVALTQQHLWEDHGKIAHATGPLPPPDGGGGLSPRQ